MFKQILEGPKKFFFMAAVVAIASFAVFGNRGILDVYRLRKERDSIVKYNKTLAEENATIEENIRLLKSEDKRYIGYIARKELGMIGKNEAVYKIEDAH